MKNTKLIHHGGASWQTLSDAIDKSYAMLKNGKNWTDDHRFAVMKAYIQRTLRLADDMHVESLETVRELLKQYRYIDNDRVYFLEAPTDA